MAKPALFVCALVPLLFFVHHSHAQGLFHNPFSSQFASEGFLSAGNNNRGFFPHIPIIGSFFNPPSSTPTPTPPSPPPPLSPSPPPPIQVAASAASLAKEGQKELAKQAAVVLADPNAKNDIPTNYKGDWALKVKNTGVSAMHVILIPNNKLIIYDAAAFHISDIKLPDAQCVGFLDKRTNKQLRDCWAHGVEYTIATSKIRTLKMEFDPWCSSGGLTVDGAVVGTGGWDNGLKSIRYFKPCEGCLFQEFQNALSDPRWYATQITLADGRFIVVGGRRAFSYEFVPPVGQVSTKKFMLPLLDKTTDLDENNLYPFVYLSTDSNVFIFANNRSILLNPNTNAVLREFPVLNGGARNYPASAMSALLPIRLDLNANGARAVPAEVIICGGNRQDAYGLAGRGTFVPALDDCNRMVITDARPAWKKETMPSKRVMGDLLVLPNGDLLMINGAQAGTAAWFFADKPNMVPLLYKPDEKDGARFTQLKATNIPRMYHSSAALLPDGRIMIAGSNTNPGYNFTAKFPTELRLEMFTPPYLDPTLAKKRPEIVMPGTAAIQLTYGRKFDVVFKLAGPRLTDEEVKATMYAPPFTTHGFSMNQRLLVLFKDKNSVTRTDKGTHKLTLTAPPSPVFAPQGFYLLFVVYRGLPSPGVWVRISK